VVTAYGWHDLDLEHGFHWSGISARKRPRPLHHLRKGAQRGSQTAPEVKPWEYTKMKWRRAVGRRRKVRRERKLQKARPATITSFHWGYNIDDRDYGILLWIYWKMRTRWWRSWIHIWFLFGNDYSRLVASRGDLSIVDVAPTLFYLRIHRLMSKGVHRFQSLNVESRWTTITLSTTKPRSSGSEITEDWSIETEVYVSSIYFLDARRRDDKATIRHLRSLCSLNLLAVKRYKLAFRT